MNRKAMSVRKAARFGSDLSFFFHGSQPLFARAAARSDA